MATEVLREVEGGGPSELAKPSQEPQSLVLHDATSFDASSPEALQHSASFAETSSVAESTPSKDGIPLQTWR